MKMFLFDIDGTILLSGGAGKLAFDKVFLDLFNEEYIWDKIVPDGRTDPSIINELFHKRFKRDPLPEEYDQVIKKYAIEMELALKEAPNFRLMPNIEKVLDHLSNQENTSLGLATGNFENIAWLKLKRAKLDHHFHYGGFGSDHIERPILTKKAYEKGVKHLGDEPKEIFVIGDTIHDVKCGKHIGATTIAVTTGYTPKKELEKSNPDYLFDDILDMVDILS
jgi:phosphoglycolate phosphatase-like HAD superfamily hydrolase